MSEFHQTEVFCSIQVFVLCEREIPQEAEELREDISKVQYLPLNIADITSSGKRPQPIVTGDNEFELPT